MKTTQTPTQAVYAALLDILNRGNALVLQSAELEQKGLNIQAESVRKRLYYWSSKLAKLAHQLPTHEHQTFYGLLSEAWRIASTSSAPFQPLERMAV